MVRTLRKARHADVKRHAVPKLAASLACPLLLTRATAHAAIARQDQFRILAMLLLCRLDVAAKDEDSLDNPLGQFSSAMRILPLLLAVSSS